jgi:hypothetical protein
LFSRTTPRLVCIAGLTALLAQLPASAGRACGFHDDVTLARGVLNWTYPDALHVIGAISVATAAKQLMYRERPGPDPFGSHYHATVKALERAAELLSAGPDDAQPLSFSLVLVEPMLWTHFEVGSRAPRMQAHVPGPLPDQLVVVSGQDVIHAIANDGLGIGEAHRLGLIRLYGNDTQVAAFLAAFRHVGCNQPGGNTSCAQNF